MRSKTIDCARWLRSHPDAKPRDAIAAGFTRSTVSLARNILDGKENENTKKVPGLVKAIKDEAMQDVSEAETFAADDTDPLVTLIRELRDQHGLTYIHWELGGELVSRYSQERRSAV